MVKIALIAAIGKQRQLGLRGQLPWHCSGDLRLFRQRTMGHHLILGRKTFEGLGRPLPERTLLVTSRAYKEITPGVKGVWYCPSLEAALSFAREQGDNEVMVGGGAEIYSLAMPMAQVIYLSVVDYTGDADAFFPDFDHNAWTMSEQHDFPAQAGDPAWRCEVWCRA